MEPATNITLTSNHNNDQDLQFYDPTAVLGISREVAFGYLILLTGGGVEYEPPKLQDTTQVPIDITISTPTLDEHSAALAYAAIVDGNVLHACFGLKATANGRVRIGDKNDRSSSFFCCFPTSSAALQMVLPQATKDKLKLQNSVEILREVRDLDHESLESSPAAAVGVSNVPLYMQAIRAYIHCFMAIVRYHDTKIFIKGDETTNKKLDEIIDCCTSLLNKLNVFSKPKGNSELEKLQNETLKEIESGFRGLKEDIWESLEKMAAETAFTGVSVQESDVGR